MPDFSHLKKLDVTNRTAWMRMREVTPETEFEVAIATQANRPYFNAMSKMASKRVRELVEGAPMTAEALEQNRSEDRRLYPQFVMRGWRGVYDKDGDAIPFDADHARDFLSHLPDWLFDRLREFAASPRNFLSDEELPPDPKQVKELSGNSGSGSPSS